MNHASDLVSGLRCPTCHQAITMTDEDVTCTGGHVFPVHRGVPVLLDADRSIFDSQEIVASTGPTWTVRRGLRKRLPKLSTNVASNANFHRLAGELVALSERPRVLIVGGGESGVGSEALRQPGIKVITSDVTIGPATEVVADGHDLPFVDGYFDGVVVQAVMEHVLDPWRCAEEIYRVLCPGGIVYAETPFMQQVHAGAWDFVRFTELGHRRLFRRFEQIDAGIAVGPGSALAWSLCYFVASFARSPRTRKLLFAGSRFLFFWLRGFDRVLTSDVAFDAASGFYFMGSRSDETLSDRDLIASYRGGIR